ncbi:MAG: histidine phosphatase family protein [Melioribacteraceae bacterium]|nr:histidine phosphatase family protein [Melioribacteraceae bacterium]
MRNRFVLLAIILVFAGCKKVEEPKGGLEVFFIRHAETIANLTGEHNEKNLKLFSVDGLDQILKLKKSLKDYKFDNIIVSPLWRTQKTILPFLSANSLHAEVWPEFTECCWQEEKDIEGSDSIKTGAVIEIADSQLIKYRDAESHYEIFNTNNYKDGVNQVKKGFELFMDRFGNTNKKVLLVGHFHSGSAFLKMLLGKDSDENLELENAKISHLIQNKNGTFKINYLNK